MYLYVNIYVFVESIGISVAVIWIAYRIHRWALVSLSYKSTECLATWWLFYQDTGCCCRTLTTTINIRYVRLFSLSKICLRRPVLGQRSFVDILHHIVWTPITPSLMAIHSQLGTCRLIHPNYLSLPVDTANDIAKPNPNRKNNYGELTDM